MVNRSPIYDELFNMGTAMSWDAMRHQLYSVASLEGMSCHRTFLSDLLALRSGGDPSYDWRDSSGTTPFEDVPSAELEEMWGVLNERIREALRSLPSEDVEAFSTHRGQWKRNDGAAYWSSSGDTAFPLGHALGREFESSAPVINGVPSLLYEAFTEVTRGLALFNSVSLEPLPGIHEIWDVGTELIKSSAPDGDSGVGLDGSISSIRVMGAIISSPGNLDGGSVLIRVAITFGQAISPPTQGAVVSSPVGLSSPLFGTVVSLSAEDAAWSARGLPPARLLELPNGPLCGFTRGSLILTKETHQLYTPAPEVTLTPNPLVARALASGRLRPTLASKEDLPGFSSIWQLGAGGDLVPVTGLDGVEDLDGAQYAIQGEQIFKGLVEFASNP